MSQTNLQAESVTEGTDTEMDAANTTWGAAVDEIKARDSIDCNPVTSKSQLAFSNPKFSKIDDTSHFLNESASEADIHHELSAVSTPISTIKDASNTSITAHTSDSFDIAVKSNQKKRKIRDSPTYTFSSDSFVSVNSSILDDTVVKACGPVPGLKEIYKVTHDTFDLLQNNILN